MKCTGWRRLKSPRFREKNVVTYMISDHSILELSWPLKVISQTPLFAGEEVEDLRDQGNCLRTHSQLARSHS